MMKSGERSPVLAADSLSAGERVILAVDFFSGFSSRDENYEPGAYFVCRRQRTRGLRRVGNMRIFEAYGCTVREIDYLGTCKLSNGNNAPLLLETIQKWTEKFTPVAMSSTFVETVLRFGIVPPRNLAVFVLSRF